MANKDMNMSDYMTVSEVADNLRFNPNTVRGWCQKYPSLAIKAGGCWRLRREAIEALKNGTPLEAA